MIRNETKRF
uniref:Uncharacterized protein n=1 Tax=Anguilla anguilla TaxID=7936 RepID=A0A0E9SG11_ANGAN